MLIQFLYTKTKLKRTVNFLFLIFKDKEVKNWVKKVNKTKRKAVENFTSEVVLIKDTLQSLSDLKDSEKIPEIQDPSDLRSQYREMLDGVKSTLEQFDEIMAKFNIEESNPIGEMFDPEKHEAMYMVNDPTKDPNTI